MSANTLAEANELTAAERAERQRAVVHALLKVLPASSILYLSLIHI
jgi:glycolate oxidase